MVGQTTSQSDPRAPSAKGASLPGIGLALCWSLREPVRVGEVVLFTDEGRPRVFGRTSEPGDPPPCRFMRHRPKASEPTGDFLAPAVSRRQLVLVRERAGLRARRIGRCEMSVNGHSADTALLRPGDVLSLKDQLSFVCIERSAELPVPLQFDASKAPFGEADAVGLVGESEVAWRLRFQLATLARARGHVLVVGPLGAGKETVARGLHGLSSRAGRAVVARHASTIGSLEELFGDATSKPPREGIIETADGSTLLLDAVDQLPFELQSALLGVLDHGEVHRVGEVRPRRVDARLVCTCLGPPSDALLARFQLRIDVPGLEQRREDVPLLMRALLARARGQVPELGPRFAEDNGEWRIDPKLVHALIQHTWQQHVRELDAALWTSIAESPEDFLALTPGVRAQLGLSSEPAEREPTVEEVNAALERHGGNQSRAWQELGLSNRFALIRLMRKYSIPSRR